MNSMYNHLSRSAFHMGLSALRTRLKMLEESQRKLKDEIHQPHNDNTWRAQSSLVAGKVQITATLNVYLHVRGKRQVDENGRPHHRVDSFDTAWYQRARDHAQAEFDQQVEIHQAAWEASAGKPEIRQRLQDVAATESSSD